MPNENKDKVEKSEVTGEKVASALNAATDAKNTSEEVLKSNEEINVTLKSVADSLDTLAKFTVKSEEDKEEKEETEQVKELKSEIALINSKLSASKSGQLENKSKAITEKSKTFLKDFATSIINKSKTTYGAESDIKEGKESLFDECGVLSIKSLRTFDNTSAGADVPAKRMLGEIDINLQTISPTTSLVNNVSAGAVVAGALGYKTFDESMVEIYESGEMVGKQETPNVKRGDVDIYVTQNSAKVKISDKTLNSSESGEMATNPLLREFMAIEKRYEKKIARKILNGKNNLGIYGVFSSAQESGSKIKTLSTATDNIVTLKDISSLGLNLKSEYLRNAAILIDRAALYELYYDEGNDGHLKMEQFDYANGLASLRTPERVIPLIGVDSSFLVADVKSNDGFANYTPFAGAVAPANLAGYTPSQFAGVSGATDNEGKVVAVLADFNSGYSLARSSVVRTGVDDSFGNLLNDGYVWGGKIGYVGGKAVNQEAMTLLYVK